MKTIKQAEHDCREAARSRLAERGLPYDAVTTADGGWIPAWNIHHAVEIEGLTEPVENRIQAILTTKSAKTQVERLDNFRLLSLDSVTKLPSFLGKAGADLDKARADWDKAWADCASDLAPLHLADVPNHTWNGKTLAGVPHGY